MNFNLSQGTYIFIIIVLFILLFISLGYKSDNWQSTFWTMFAALAQGIAALATFLMLKETKEQFYLSNKKEIKIEPTYQFINKFDKNPYFKNLSPDARDQCLYLKNLLFFTKITNLSKNDIYIKRIEYTYMPQSPNTITDTHYEIYTNKPIVPGKVIFVPSYTQPNLVDNIKNKVPFDIIVTLTTGEVFSYCYDINNAQDIDVFF